MDKGKISEKSRVMVAFTPEEYHLVSAATPYIGSGKKTSLGGLCRRAAVALARNTLKGVGILDQVLDNYNAVNSPVENSLDDIKPNLPNEASESDISDDLLEDM